MKDIIPQMVQLLRLYGEASVQNFILVYLRIFFPLLRPSLIVSLSLYGTHSKRAENIPLTHTIFEKYISSYVPKKILAGG